VTVARKGDELADTLRRNSGLGGGVQQLEEENGGLRESRKRPKDELPRIEVGRQSEFIFPQKAVTVGRSKVQEDLSNVQAERANMKEEIRTRKPKLELLTRRAADVTVRSASNVAAPARRPLSNSSPPQKISSPRP
jgi:hypothetical protein